MARDIIDETPEIWGKDYSTDSATVERDYDAFGESGTYDETFEEWGYVGPETAAAIMRNFVPPDSLVLDAACGSGLTGTALQTLGYRHIVGIDCGYDVAVCHYPDRKLLLIHDHDRAHVSVMKDLDNLSQRGTLSSGQHIPGHDHVESFFYL